MNLAAEPTPATAGRAPNIDAGEAFASFTFTRGELLVLAGALILTAALQLTPVLHSPAAIPLLCLLSMLCWTTPVSAFYFIAASQSLPFPETSAFNPTQIGVLTFLIVFIVRHGRFRFRDLSVLWVFMPFLVWYALVGGEGLAFFSYKSNFIRVLVYCLISCHYINLSGGQYLKCLLGLCLGAVTVGISFWFSLAALPVELVKYGGPVAERGGYLRLGGSRADAVASWPPLLMGAFALVGVAISALGLNVPRRQCRLLLALSAGVMLFIIPPLLGTMTNAAYFGFAIMTVITLAASVHYFHRAGLTLLAKRRILSIAIACLVLGGTMLQFDVLQVRGRLAGLWSVYSTASHESSMAASRTDVWACSIATIRKCPILGVHLTGVVDVAPYQYSDTGRYASHNVFLEYGRHAGIPGMVMLACFFFYPVLALSRLRTPQRYLAFYIALTAMFMLWMVLSYEFYKTFWALWMMMSMAARDGARAAQPSQAQPSREQTS